MRTKLLLSTIAITSFIPMAFLFAKDQEIMNINGKSVPKSEFEYLYNKNKQQQLEQQSFDKYVDMFITYKLKVADAEAAGIDTTSSFIREFNGYRNDLAAPYLEDKSVIEKLAQEAYDRKKEDVDVWQIMIPLENAKTKSQSSQKELLDSVRTSIINGADFSEMAVKYSINAAQNKGHLGFIRGGLTPYEFEKAAYSTPLGQISEIVKTRYGFHIIKPVAKRPSSGTVLVEHIMKLTPKAKTDADELKAKNAIDSIYNVIRSGANFEDVAKAESDDRGSKLNGGKLPWFGVGQMVPEFEKVAFELAKDSISAPFKTSYGYHIVKKLDSANLLPYDSIKDQIKNSFFDDNRCNMGKIERLAQLKKQYKYKVNIKGLNEINGMIEKCNGCDSTVIVSLVHSSTPLIKFEKESIPVSALISKISGNKSLNKIAATSLVERTINEIGDSAVIEYTKQQLELKDKDYANLIHEYRDGLLLFEISNRKVWDKSSTDKEGLEKYFENHRNNYVWNSPKYKGYLIQATNDSIAQLLKTASDKLGGDSIVSTLKKQFKRDIKVEKVLVSKGENKLIDALIFNKDIKFKNPDKKYPIFFTIKDKIIAFPEEASDVRGQVTIDYQNELEADWIKELKTKYSVKINPKVISKIK